MSRRLRLAGVLLLVVSAAMAAWLVTSLERVPTRIHEPPQGEARRNPWLALERFTVRMGGGFRRSSDVQLLDRLPQGGTLLLAGQRSQVLTAERLSHLLVWVQEGGYLLVVAERPNGSDPLLDKLGVRRAWTKGTAVGESFVSVKLPGKEEAFRLKGIGFQLIADKNQPAWGAGSPDQGIQLMHFGFGHGQITVSTGLDERLNNREIGQLDHAALYWTLLGRYDASPRPHVILLARLEMPSLFAWLWESARALCVAMLVLLTLWLARTVPRFGPVREQPASTRRELREHLTAVGRFLWRSGSLTALLGPAREHFRHHLALRQPTIAALTTEKQAAALAVLCNRPAVLIAAALSAPVANPKAFTEALRLLYNLEREL